MNEPRQVLKQLNLGCGEFKKDGYINVDIRHLLEPQVIHDLNKFPYPFQDNKFDLIEASHIMEHSEDIFNIISWLHRMLNPGGKLISKIPHFSRGFTHTERKRVVRPNLGNLPLLFPLSPSS